MIIQGTAIKGMTVSSSAATVEPDSYFNLVTLLLPGNGTNGAQNNTFLDSSTNNFTITRNGNTTQGTFSPFSEADGRWGNYFDGDGDYLSVGTNTAFAFGTGDFTLEAWVYLNQLPTAFPGQTAAIIIGAHSWAGGAGINWVFRVNATTGYLFFEAAGGASVISSSAVSINSWNHVAAVRSGTTLTLYLNGVSVGSGTISANLTSTIPVTVGHASGGGAYGALTGYVSNARIVKGTAVYTSAFTPSTTPLTAISGTSLLTCQSNRFVDNSANAFALTVNGNVSVQPFSPFNPDAAYSTTSVGGSGYFDGSGDYLTVPNNAAFDLASGNFTIECWAYPTTWNATAVGIFGKRSSTAVANQIGLEFAGSGGTIRFAYNSSGSEIGVNGAAGTLNAWQHIAVVRNGSTLTIYKDGVSTGTATINVSITTNADALAIGVVSSNGSFPITGYITNLRIVKGTALYTSAFTPPTSPPTAITNTSLLLNFTNAGIYDAAAKSDWETIGNSQISTVQSKFGGSSMYFDGSGDALANLNSGQYNLFDFGTGDFTIEFWFYCINTTSGMVYTRAVSGHNLCVVFVGANATDRVSFFAAASGGGTAIQSAGTPVVSTWNHAAIVRQNGTVTVYLNGTGGTPASNTTNITAGSTYGSYVPTIGAYYHGGISYPFAGYIDDFRITKGYARYTANFTPPTSAFPTQ